MFRFIVFFMEMQIADSGPCGYNGNVIAGQTSEEDASMNAG